MFLVLTSASSISLFSKSFVNIIFYGPVNNKLERWDNYLLFHILWPQYFVKLWNKIMWDKKLIISRDHCFAKYLGTSFSMQSNSKSFCFSVNYNFIVVMPRQKYLLTFFSQVIALNVFLKKVVLYTTVVIRGLCLWYNSSDFRYIFCNKPFKAFLKSQIFKDKPTSLLAIEMCNFYTTLTQ